MMVRIPHARPALVLLLVFTVLTGLLYPLAVTGIAQWCFPDKANGSLLVRNGRIIGSKLIGQSFHSPRYVWGRLSATAAKPYDASASSGSNAGPMHAALTDAARARIAALRQADSTQSGPVPVDLATASGSGLDPHISIAAARYQAQRVARERGASVEAILALIEQYTEERDLGVLGEPGVHVLLLNLALDARYPAAAGGL